MQPNQYQNKKIVRTMYKLLKLLVKILVILFTIYIVARMYSHYNPSIKINTITVDNSKELLSTKIELLKAEVVATLRSCESAGYKEDNGIIIFDSNKVASIGTLQFQKLTIIYYYKALYNKVITGKEAVLIALDDNLSGKLATDIMFTTKNKASKDWYNCSQRHNLDQRIDIINQLTK
jgi:hypothetical protein